MRTQVVSLPKAAEKEEKMMVRANPRIKANGPNSNSPNGPNGHNSNRAKEAGAKANGRREAKAQEKENGLSNSRANGRSSNKEDGRPGAGLHSKPVLEATVSQKNRKQHRKKKLRER